MSWQPTMSWHTAQARARLTQQIRSFFAERGVTEVETPAMALNTITDVHLEPIVCQYSFLLEGGEQCYLQTSPEYAMKRLLASGYGDIYQIAKAFRHEPYGRIHNPEFTMLEWYRLGFDQHQLIAEVSALLCLVLDVANCQKLSYQQAFIDHVSFDPLTATIEECLTYIDQHQKSAQWLTDCNDLDTLLQFIFCEFIEPKIGQTVPCFVYDFPASQASLARINNEDSRTACRFECYFKGIELVNGFDELTDYQIQVARFNSDVAKRRSLGLADREADNAFLAAIKSGLPQCAGVALGIDRLVMLALEKTSIAEVITFPIHKS